MRTLIMILLFAMPLMAGEVDDLKEQVKEIDEKIKALEAERTALEKKIEALDGGKAKEKQIADLDEKIKALSEEVKQIRDARDARKEAVYKPYIAAVKAVELFEDEMKVKKKAYVKIYNNKIKDHDKNKKKRMSNTDKAKLKLRYVTKPMRKLEAKLVTLKAKADKDVYRAIWKKETKVFDKKLGVVKDKITALQKQKRNLKSKAVKK